MRAPALWLAFLTTCGYASPSFAQKPTQEPTPPQAWGEAFSQPLPDMPDADRAAFLRGRSLFRQNWVVAPADDPATGLGPLYNRLSCIACHTKNGRGAAPLAGQRLQGALVRLSVPGRAANGGPQPHPRYGDQFNEEGIPGVPGEGRVTVQWLDTVMTLPDGERVPLRRPALHFKDLAYGPLKTSTRPVMMSLRVGQPVFGLGLIEAAQVTPDKAHQNQVWRIQTASPAPGRFGLKANMANLREQIAGAMIGDLGITSSLHPHENCSAVQTACQQAPSGGHPELSEPQLDDLETYLVWLAPPAPRHSDAVQARQGLALFTQAGCTQCHSPELQTTALARFPALSPRRIAPFSDLLIHDMGEGLADHRPDFQATGRQWRTPPLWGIGLAQLVNDQASYLHDGRARTLQEAILWHGGEAASARRHFMHLSRADRTALLDFLKAL